jgi:hypothetical protein
MGNPYSRVRLPLQVDASGGGGGGKWRRPSNQNLSPYSQSFPPQPSLRVDRNPYIARLPSTSTPITLPSPPLFTVFTTTDLRILRCTRASYPLTGFPPQEFINTNLLDWVMPHDRPLLEMEHGRLMNNPMCPGHLHSDRETQESMSQRSEAELQSPVAGMKEPYPNQNVRVMRADQQYSVFNVRLHLGGGLGGSLWRPETLGKVYFVISLLLLPPPTPSAIPLPPHQLAVTDRSGHNSGASTPVGDEYSPQTSFRPPPVLSSYPTSTGNGSSGSNPTISSASSGGLDPQYGQASEYWATSVKPEPISPSVQPAPAPPPSAGLYYGYPMPAPLNSQYPSNISPPSGQLYRPPEPDTYLALPPSMPAQPSLQPPQQLQQQHMQGFSYDPQYMQPYRGQSEAPPVWGGEGQGLVPRSLGAPSDRRVVSAPPMGGPTGQEMSMGEYDEYSGRSWEA